MTDSPIDASDDNETNAAAPTQADLYKALQRIGELEDQKKAIQVEIDDHTKGLQDAIKTIDSDSLLAKMLKAALNPKTAPKPAAKTTRRKKATSKKKR